MKEEMSPAIARPALEESRPGPAKPVGNGALPVVLSLDIEEHYRIEAAAGLDVPPSLQVVYRRRMARTTDWLLEKLASRNIRATFFILGQIAKGDPGLIRAIAGAGHEVASHGWDHRRILTMDRPQFVEDIRRSKDALEQASGTPVLGYRAPTFSIVRRTAWAIDVLAEAGFLYDSSIYPVHHDRYGVPDAPRHPFQVRGVEREILEIPPATLGLGRLNVPIGGGGYFRLLPYPLTWLALAFSRRDRQCIGSMLYFHPWEFDPDQPALPLRGLSRFRTYVGIRRGQRRLASLMADFSFVRGIDLARRLIERSEGLPAFCLTS
ncbi:XrtA system polysaccharide deacetylase [Aquisphaera insulae]|uniref:XrtA system polysaccharide deacetylase n=1 Tax=Aquisphaera insulae TaxID=2712864 RepID=UPI002030225A|nr:XrtA system polysaccharide deacetylase [Aquisphaera insulae]